MKIIILKNKNMKIKLFKIIRIKIFFHLNKNLRKILFNLKIFHLKLQKIIIKIYKINNYNNSNNYHLD